MTTHVDNPQEWFIRTADTKPQLGALTDLFSSIALLIVAFLVIGARRSIRWDPLPEPSKVSAVSA